MSDEDVSNEKHAGDLNVSEFNNDTSPAKRYPVKWYRSTYYNAVILGG